MGAGRMTDLALEPPVTEPTPAPEIFVDGYQSFSMTGGVAKLTFFSLQHDPADDVQTRRIVLRLAVPLAVLDGIARGVTQMIERIVAEANVQAVGRPARTAEDADAH